VWCGSAAFRTAIALAGVRTNTQRGRISCHICKKKSSRSAPPTCRPGGDASIQVSCSECQNDSVQNFEDFEGCRTVQEVHNFEDFEVNADTVQFAPRSGAPGAFGAPPWGCPFPFPFPFPSRLYPCPCPCPPPYHSLRTSTGGRRQKKAAKQQDRPSNRLPHWLRL
jgi:hypothetical protein